MLLIKNVDLYSPEHLGLRDILLCNDKIVAISEKLDYNFPDLQVLEAKGKIGVPGFIDQHVHLTGGGGESGLASRVPEIQLAQCIRAGVTTVVGLLGTDSQSRSVENLLAKTKALNEEGITAYCLTGAYEYPSPTLTGSLSKDIIYLSEVLGVKLAISDHRSSHVTQEELIRLASQVRIAGLIGAKPGVIHLHVGSGAAGVLPLVEIVNKTDIPIWHFRPTHIGETPGAEVFGQMGGYLDVTSGKDPSLAAERIAHLMTTVPPIQITLSSDANGSQPVWNEQKELVGLTAASMDTLYQTTLALINEQGLDLATALGFTTSHVARALNLFPRKGCIRPQGDGDIVLLDQNLGIETVIAKGKVMMDQGEILVKGMFV